MQNRRSAAGSPRAGLLPWLAVLLTLSCSEPSAPTGDHDGSASFAGSVAPKPVFIVEPTMLDVPTYDGSGQSVHPDVVAFDSPWHGARYWMTMTPYPKSRQTLENPSILASDDGMRVRVPAGLTNPVIGAPRRASDYNSDPELLYEPQSDRLVLFHRLVEKKTNTVHVTVSRDGVNWTRMPAPFWERSHRAVSPTVASRTSAPARMWYVNAGKEGCDAKATSVLTRRATDLSGRVVETKWTSPVPTDLSIPGYQIWHIKARWIPAKSEYWMLLSAFQTGRTCQIDDLFFARSEDGVHWTVYSEPVLRHEEREWTAAAVYRSSFLYDDESDELSLWISARGADGAWRMGYARARYPQLLAALEAGTPLSPRAKITFSAPSLAANEQP